MIRFACPRCGMQLSAPEDCAGQKTNCPTCGQRIQLPALPAGPPLNKTVLAPLVEAQQHPPLALIVPPSETVIRFACPCCGSALSAPPACAGRSSKCRQCGQAVTVPSQPVPALAPAPPVATVVPVAVAVPAPEPTTHCPRCQKTLSYDPAQAGKIIVCPFCGETFAAPGKQPVAVVKPVPEPSILDNPEEYRRPRLRRLRREREEDRRPRSSGGSLLGTLVLIGGLLGLVNYSQMDTTVPTTFGGRVHNIGLMQERQTGLILSGGAAAVGVLCLALTGSNRRRD